MHQYDTGNQYIVTYATVQKLLKDLQYNNEVKEDGILQNLELPFGFIPSYPVPVLLILGLSHEWTNKNLFMRI